MGRDSSENMVECDWSGTTGVLTLSKFDTLGAFSVVQIDEGVFRIGMLPGMIFLDMGLIVFPDSVKDLRTGIRKGLCFQLHISWREGCFDDGTNVERK